MTHTAHIFLRLLSLLPAAVSCGTADPDYLVDASSLFPVAVGNRWTYKVTDTDELSVKVQTITGTVSAAGLAAFRFVSANGNNETVSVQALDGTKLVRISEQNFDDGLLEEDIRYSPPALRVDTSYSRLGGTYTSEHLEEHLDPSGTVLSEPPPVMKTETFTVEAVDESLTVPAGTFTCVRIRRDTSGGASKTFWYARGVGKVREAGGQTESLLDYTITEDDGVSP